MESTQECRLAGDRISLRTPPAQERIRCSLDSRCAASHPGCKVAGNAAALTNDPDPHEKSPLSSPLPPSATTRHQSIARVQQQRQFINEKPRGITRGGITADGEWDWGGGVHRIRD